MSKKREIIKVPFYGNDILVIEKNSKQFVAMKPIVKALGLDWHKQYELINRDPVLSGSTIPITGIVAEDGKQREMICLPLEYLNGWLFKVPASRYKGKKRDAIIKYQRECYQALYNYFHNGGAINPLAGAEKILVLFEKAIAKIDQCNEIIRRQQETIDLVTSDSVYGEFSEVTGKRKLVLVRQHFRSYASPKKKKSKKPMQMVFGLFKGDK
jgi:hypothetical protein